MSYGQDGADQAARSEEAAKAAKQAASAVGEFLAAGNLSAAEQRVAEAEKLADDAVNAANEAKLAAEAFTGADATRALEQATALVTQATEAADKVQAAKDAIDTAKAAAAKPSFGFAVTPKVLDVKGGKRVEPKVPGSFPPASSFVEYAGVLLACAIISVIVIVLLGTGYILFEWNAHPLYPVDEIAKYLTTRDDWLAYFDKREAAAKQVRIEIAELLKLVLVNILLPVLTAILGYVFGTQRQKAKEPSEESGENS